MTTPTAAAAYLSEHMAQWAGKGYAVFNPHNKPLEDLPVIYGFNNGGSPGWWAAVAIAEDGHALGSHLCSDEGFMYHDLGIVEGSRPDRHENDYRAHYPDGYRMDFVSHADVPGHAALQLAFQRNKALAEETKQQGAAA